MALQNKSLLLYGYEITANNQSLDFRASSGGPILAATLNRGTYSLTEFLAEIQRAMSAADPSNAYTVTADRTFVGGTENRITIATAGTYLDLLFGTGPRIATSVGPLAGFNATDLTGATTYTAQNTSGFAVVPEYPGYSYLGPDFMRNVFGSLNISTNGIKEAVVWQIQKFFQVQFKYEPESKVITEWADLMTWLIQQKAIEFTPDITQPNTFYICTLEATGADGKGLGYQMTEMLPDFPFYYQTGNLKFRQKVS